MGRGVKLSGMSYGQVKSSRAFLANRGVLYCNWFLLVTAIVTTGPVAKAAPSDGQKGDKKRPNVVFLLADDLGYGDLPCYGRDDLSTPAIDRLAREGVRFTQAYANGPECTPTRAAFLTGRYQQRLRGLECAIGIGDVGRYDEAIELGLKGELGLSPQAGVIPSALKRAGYRTALVGKWHLGYREKFAPLRHGFDFARYCVGGGMDYFYHVDNLGIHNVYENGEPLYKKQYFTDMIGEVSEEFIKRAREHQTTPFFLYVAFTAPHSPFQGPDDDPGHPLPGHSPLWDQAKGPSRTYCRMIERMDRAVGRILDALSEYGFAEDTIVIFTSDNGATPTGSTGGLRGHKGTTWEGGIRVPAIVRWPGRVPAGTVSHQVCITMDWTVSILNICAGGLPAGYRPDGMDIVGLLENGKAPQERTLFWRARRAASTWWAVRNGDWKYVRHRVGERAEEFLFDLCRDPRESNDLLHAHPEIAAQLRGLLESWENEMASSADGSP